MFSSAYSAEKDHWHGILKVVNRADITRDVPGYRSVNSAHPHYTGSLCALTKNSKIKAQITLARHPNCLAVNNIHLHYSFRNLTLFIKRSWRSRKVEKPVIGKS